MQLCANSLDEFQFECLTSYGEGGVRQSDSSFSQMVQPKFTEDICPLVGAPKFVLVCVSFLVSKPQSVKGN